MSWRTLQGELLSFRSPTVCRTPHCKRHWDSSANLDEPDAALRLVTVALADVKRAAKGYGQGWTLRQIGAELGISSTAVSDQLRRAGVPIRRVGSSSHPTATQQILELRDEGLTWNDVAKQVDMTVSGAWSRYRRARPPRSPRLGRWQQLLADGLDKNVAIGARAAVADHLGRAPTRAELTAARRAAHSLAATGRADVLHVPESDVDDNAGDRNYLVLARPNVIMNDTRLRGLAVAGH